MDPVSIALLAGGLASLAGAGIWQMHKRERARQALWRQIAAAYGGSFRAARFKGLRYQREGIDVELAGTRVWLDSFLRSTGNTSVPYTRCRASFAVPAGPAFTIYREHLLATIGKALGRQDVALGIDPEFDAHFVVRCDDERAVRALWSKRLQTAAFLYLSNARITSDGARVAIEMQGLANKEAQLRSLIEVAGGLAGADLFGIEALRALPDAELHPPAGPWDDRSPPRAIVRAPLPVELSPVAARGRAATQAVCRGVRRDDLEAWIERGEIAGELRASDLAPGIARLLRDIGTARVVCAGGVATLTWARVETAPERLIAGARLVASFAAADPTGAYR